MVSVMATAITICSRYPQITAISARIALSMERKGPCSDMPRREKTERTRRRAGGYVNM